ncbi:MAG: tagaturonate reductase [Defluviitaleaceae bacterium]|nr:tagaturonate reductase [Defluviitaleaceae bacterium]
MRQIGTDDKNPPKPDVVVQFGEGNFLRAFADYMIDVANEKGVFCGGVAVVKPISSGGLEKYERQGAAYTVILRGKEGGRNTAEHRIISCINRVVDPFADYAAYLDIARGEDLRFAVSNTTEAGIVFDADDSFEAKPAASFPGKLVQLLFERYGHFAGDVSKGLIMLPAELIESNGAKLRECVMKLVKLWGLPEGFAAWIDESCIFADCLVDRIVSGYPAEEAESIERDMLGYRDELMVVGEPFGLWVVASDRHAEIAALFPLDKAGMQVVFTDDLRPYRERKVRLLNGAHTASVLAAYIMGLDTVGDAMANPTVRAFVEKVVYDEISPTVPLPAREVRAFADSVLERFENPYLRHNLLSISLNSVSKWKARILPSLKDSLAATGVLPPCICFSMAALAAFYRSGERGEFCLVGRRAGEAYSVKDDAFVLDFFATNYALPNAEYVRSLLANTAFWGEDLTQIAGFADAVTFGLDDIAEHGMADAVRRVVSKLGLAEGYHERGKDICDKGAFDT